MIRRRLPIGVQTFRELRERGCYYVDKTSYIERLLEGGKHYFLSRPRRFGKSLLLDTLKELFEGNEALFEGLYIHDRHMTGRSAIQWCGWTSLAATSSSPVLCTPTWRRSWTASSCRPACAPATKRPRSGSAI